MDTKQLRAYYQLTKPGIIKANVVTAIAGYLFGSKWAIDASSLLGVVAGTGLIIAASCTYNNVLDRHIDRRMTRTRQRALVTGDISVPAALVFATVLLLTGFVTLLLTTNLTAVTYGFIGFIDYVFIYGWAKRHTAWSTIIGSVAGATSIAAGYVAATNTSNSADIWLFLILVLWQMPHFYAIAMYRRADYQAINLPLMPLIKSELVAKRRIMLYILTLTIVFGLLAMWDEISRTSSFILIALGVAWFIKGLRAYPLPAAAWGKQMFLFSLIVNLGISLAVAIGSVTP